MVTIHRSAQVSLRARLGTDISIQEGVVIRDNVTIGSGTIIRPGCIIGTPGEKYGHFNSAAGYGVVIGEGCIISDNVKIHAGTERPTAIGERVHLLAASHVGHDAVIEDDATISVMAVIGGHAYVMRGANVGMGAKILQRQVVGSYCMIGMNAAISRSLKMWPGNTFAGVPAKMIKANTIGLERAGVSNIALMVERDRYNEICLAQGLHQ